MNIYQNNASGNLKLVASSEVANDKCSGRYRTEEGQANNAQNKYTLHFFIDQ